MDPAMVCNLCQEPFGRDENIINSGGQVWHEPCFVCVECFQPFPDGVFYEHEGRKYCENDFQALFAPCCSGCGEFVIGRVIRAMSQCWHPTCFKCVSCHVELADIGFVKNQGRPLCKKCNTDFKGGKRKFCQKCSLPIQGEHIVYKFQVVHPEHFNCHKCKKELTANCREKDSQLYCLRCFDNMESSICAACRRPIESRVIHALGKTWHPEHFVCSHCEKPFEGRRHYEKKGKAYCERDYKALFGDVCFSCSKPCRGDVVNVLNKTWCIQHFRCTACDVLLATSRGGARYADMDERPFCRRCFERVPAELRRRLKKQSA